MDRRRVLKLGAAAVVSAASVPALAETGPRLLFIHGGTNTQHLFAGNARLWMDSLSAGRHGARKPGEVRTVLDHERLDVLAKLDDPSAWRPSAVVIYAWWGTEHGGSIGEAEREGLRRYVADGGGLVVAHIGNGCFDDWPEYRKIVGGVWVTGKSGHTAIKPFTVHITDRDHPVTRGLNDFQITDELYQHLVISPEARIRVLATATETGTEEPMAWVNRYGRGRVFYCALGHGPEAWGNDGFQRLMTGGLNWVLK